MFDDCTYIVLVTEEVLDELLEVLRSIVLVNSVKLTI